MLVSDVIKQQSLSGKAGVCGKVEAGAVTEGSQVLVMPSGAVATIKELQVRGQRHRVAIAGDSVDVGLAGLDEADLEAGSTLCDPEFPVRVAPLIQVRSCLCRALVAACSRL